MNWNNVPDDWASYERVCPICGTRWHESEGSCWCELLTDEEREELQWHYEQRLEAEYDFHMMRLRGEW